MSANLLFDNATPERFSEAVAALSPDIIVVQEARHDWPDALRNLPGYPNRVGPDLYRWNSNMVLSRYPVRGRLLSDPAQGERIGGGPAMRAEIDLPDRAAPLVVYAVHAPTPRTLAGWQGRSAYLEQVARMIAAEPPGTEIVLAGDWNTPVWSPTYARMLQASGLEATERSAWPAASRLFWRNRGVTLIGSPVDHVAVSEGIAVADHFLGPDFGSDHLPVVVDLKLP
jgi:endonuclease/exonuclease/phosphatase (EEP) superfamily protein YafD